VKALTKIAACILTLSTSMSMASDNKIAEKTYELPKCSAPIASVVVGKFSCKAGGCQGGGNSSLAQLIRLSGGGGSVSDTLGAGMSDMLTTVLKSTGCFDIQEREAMDELAKELALVGKKVEVQQADFMLAGSITSMDMSSDTASLGGGFIPILGMVSITTKKADIGLDIKLLMNSQLFKERKVYKV
jgi:curli biogenesis system outer membrane secretion channel CsgG